MAASKSVIAMDNPSMPAHRLLSAANAVGQHGSQRQLVE